MNDPAVIADAVMLRKISPLLGRRAAHVLPIIDHCILQVWVGYLENNKTAENTIASIHKQELYSGGRGVRRLQTRAN